MCLENKEEENALIQGLEYYIKKRKERLITAANSIHVNINKDRKITMLGR